MTDTSSTTDAQASTVSDEEILDELLANVEREVTESERVDRSAELLIGRLAEALRDAADDAENAATDPDAPEAPESESTVLTTLIGRLRGFAERLDASQGSLSAAVVAGTPASPLAPEPVPSQAAVDSAIESGAVTVPITQAAVDAAVEAGDITLPTAGETASAPTNQQVSTDLPAGEWDPSDVEPSDGIVTDELGVERVNPAVSQPESTQGTTGPADATTGDDGN